MKVVYFLTHPIQYQVPMIRHLRAGGVDIEVVYESLQGAEGYFDPGFARQISWDVPLLEGYPHRVLPTAEGFRKRVRACREVITATGAQAVWVHGWGFKISRSAWMAAKQLRLPVLLRGEAHLGCIQSRGIRRWVHRATLSAAFRSISRFLAIGSANREFYLRYGVHREKITLMPYAVDNAFFQARCREAATSRESFRAGLRLPPDVPVILFCGKLIPEKSPRILVEALSLMKTFRKPALLFVGDGPLRTELEGLAADRLPGRVIFAGFRNQTELAAFYDLCDVMVLPSDFEPWGLVVNEVMNAGRAAVVSDSVGAGFDLVEKNLGNGAVFPTGDAVALAQALDEILTTAEKTRLAGERSREIIQRWSFDEDLSAMHEALGLLARAP